MKARFVPMVTRRPNHLDRSTINGLIFAATVLRNNPLPALNVFNRAGQSPLRSIRTPITDAKKRKR